MFNTRGINKSILVACSGGSDSLALLFYLHSINLQPIALHINHETQESSNNTEQTLRSICSQRNIPFHSIKIGDKIHKTSQEHMRKARYEALISFAHKNKHSQICTAHTYDDQIENFLIRLFRGSGIEGLSNMQHTQVIESIELIRPLLHTRKIALQNYLHKNNISWIEDPSNQSTKYLRNKIRLETLPFLSKNHPNIGTNIKTSQNNLSSANKFIQDYIAHTLKTKLTYLDAGLCMVDNLIDEHEFIQNMIINRLTQKMSTKQKYHIQISSGFYGEINDCYIAFDRHLYILSYRKASTNIKTIIQKIHFSSQDMANKFKAIYK